MSELQTGQRLVQQRARAPQDDPPLQRGNRLRHLRRDPRLRSAGWPRLDDSRRIRETLAATARSNVSIYAVDARGLTSLGDESIGVGSFANADWGTAPDGSAVAPPRDIGTNGLMNDLRLSQDSLRALSEDTGGFAAVNSNDFKTAFERIVKDNSSYYVLAYYPPDPKRDGKFHRIQVKVNRPGLTVRSRRGYAAARGIRRSRPRPAG